MGDDPRRVYFDYFDPITSPLPIPSEGIDGECNRVVVSIPSEWVMAIEAALRRLEYHDAWDGDEEQSDWAVQQISTLIERLYEGQETIGLWPT